MKFLKRSLNLKKFLGLRSSTHSLKRNMEQGALETDNEAPQTITEGSTSIKTTGKVFYNPVQEFNRDLSISVLTAFASNYKREKHHSKSKTEDDDVNVIIAKGENKEQCGQKDENGITILEALSATGLRSIRYAKEVPGVKAIIANDISKKAFTDIKTNIQENKVEEVVTASLEDATMLMYKHRRENQFDAIDLDPYGCPSIFLDSAVQAVKDGGLLLVTATDMAVLAGNSPETCYVKYGAVSLRIKCCHEMALRILLQCIEAHANRYGRYIEPLLSVSADFYIRVFVRLYSSANMCKRTTSKLSMVYHCTGCDSFTLQPLGVLRQTEKHLKFGLPSAPPVANKCEHCGHSHHIGGPIWSASLHKPEFIQQVLSVAPDSLKTIKRIRGVLTVIGEELPDCPLYYTLPNLSGVLHVVTPPMLSVRSALLNAGYEVSYTHMHKSSIKTNAPARAVWDVMRCWQKKNPVNAKRLTEDSIAKNILSVEPEREYSFEMHADANPESKRMGLVRFQENPLPFWGPGTRATAMVGDQKVAKSKRNQGKRKRELSEENLSKSVYLKDSVDNYK